MSQSSHHEYKMISMEDQDELIIRKSECEELELGLEANTKAVLEVTEDVGHNADLYIANANQEDNTQN